MELKIEVVKSPHPKCARCWRHKECVGSDGIHPKVCGRCVAQLRSMGQYYEVDGKAVIGGIVCG